MEIHRLDACHAVTKVIPQAIEHSYERYSQELKINAQIGGGTAFRTARKAQTKIFTFSPLSLKQ